MKGPELSPRLTFLLVLLSVCAWAEPIRVTFPAERQRLPGVEQTYVIGAVEPGRTELLYVNGVTTDVWRTGAFLAMVPVEPGTNTLTICCGRDRLVRKFVVAEPVKPGSWKRFEPIASDDDPRLGAPCAWRTTGTLFQNRVRTEPDGGDAIHFLPNGFTLCGAELKDVPWVAVWLENRIGFLPKAMLERLPKESVPSRGLIAPDPAAGFPEKPPYGKAPSTVRICVDAGHGGSDVGALAPHGWTEKDVNLMQARAIRDALEKAGFQVLMTRDGDSFPKLMDRPQLAYEERVDAFISVHHNSTAPQRNPREARYTATYASNEKGLALAKAIQKHVAQVLAPVKDAGALLKSLAVCRNPAVPSCLLEVDFINLPEGEEESWNPDRQHKVAEAVVCGVLDWMTEPPPPPVPEIKPLQRADKATIELLNQ